jgi:hypothetical protein
MYQPWSTGKYLIVKFTVKNVTYSFCLTVMKDAL